MNAKVNCSVGKRAGPVLAPGGMVGAALHGCEQHAARLFAAGWLELELELGAGAGTDTGDPVEAVCRVREWTFEHVAALSIW